MALQYDRGGGEEVCSQRYANAGLGSEKVPKTSSAVTLAMYRDGSSGGVCRIGVLTKDGMKRELYTPEEDNLPKFAVPPTFTMKTCL